MGGFNNKELASQAGKKSKRGPAKEVKELRTVITDLTLKKSINLEGWLDAVADKDPEKALKIYIQLADFVLPRIQRISQDEIKKPKHQFDEGLSEWVNWVNQEYAEDMPIRPMNQ